MKPVQEERVQSDMHRTRTGVICAGARDWRIILSVQDESQPGCRHSLVQTTDRGTNTRERTKVVYRFGAQETDRIVMRTCPEDTVTDRSETWDQISQSVSLLAYFRDPFLLLVYFGGSSVLVMA